MSRKYTKEDFIRKARLVHGDKYEYDDVVYNSNGVKVDITCNIHGNFLQTPKHHNRGQGCPYCAGNTKETKEEFIRKARLVHGDLYRYDDVVYGDNNKDVVQITCKIHGNFPQAPSEHKQGHGCRDCAAIRVADYKRDTREDFVRKAREVHGDTYEYNDVVYINNREIVQITCKIHGNFPCRPYNHNLGKGCPDCAEYGFNKDKPAILYYLSINNGEAYKIGITNRTVKERFNNTDLSKIKILQETKYINGADAYDAEQKILNDFKGLKYTGTDLLSSGNTELFSKDVLQLDTKE